MNNRTHLLAQLEDGQSNGDNEWEEGQLQRVPGFQTQNTNSQRDKSHGFQENEHQDWHDDFLELSFTSFANWACTFLVEFDIECQLIIFEVPGADCDLCVSDRELEGHVMGLDVVFDVIEKVTVGAGSHVIGSIVLCYFDRVRDLKIIV